MGTAAAMQALKKFTSGGKEENGSKNDFVSLAMGEASKVSQFLSIVKCTWLHCPTSLDVTPRNVYII